MTNPQQALIDAGQEFEGAGVCESKPHPVLQDMATQHAKYMAGRCKQGHQYWSSRYWKLQRLAGKKHKYREICAESWPDQNGLPLVEIGHEMFKCWEQSSGHWEVASEKHTIFGADMARGKNGVWYGCIVVGDKR